MSTPQPTDRTGAAPTPGAAPVFAVRRGCVTFDDECVVDEVDLEVGQGEFLAVLGGNGSGKTTLMRAMLGLTPLSHGTASIYGEPVARFRDWQRIGYVPQRLISGGAVPVSVVELVRSVWASPSRRFRRLPSADRARSQQALERMGLWHRRHDRFDTLSGGQQRRALIARALAVAPDALVLDEPTAGVDAESQAILATELRRLHDEGVTVVLVTHELGEIAALAGRVLVLGRGGHGSVRYDGAPPPPDHLTEKWHHHDDEPDPLRDDRLLEDL